MSFLKLTDVTKFYGSTCAVQSMNLTVQKGEFVSLLGPSGCGKTTTLQMVAGFEAVTSGRIELDGKDITHAKANTRGLGIVFQSYALFPHMTVAANVSFGLEMRKVPKAERQRRIAEVAAMLQIEHLLDRRPSQLSGGQRQRVALARALVHKPRLLLLDEPLGALDALTRIEMQQLIERLWQQHGFTVQLVTQDVSEAVAIADRVILIEDGQVGLDITVDLPRPRQRASAKLAAYEEQVLNRVLSLPELPAQPEPVSPLPTQLHWAL